MPSQLPEELAILVKEAAQSAFGDDAVVRSYGEDVAKLQLHVECSAVPTFGCAEMIGQLLTKIDHVPIVHATQRGSKVSGNAKIAYRQGYIL